jgi:hypothetical protein
MSENINKHANKQQTKAPLVWNSPDGNTSYQTDHALIETRRASNILDVRSYRGANCDSNHYLVQIKYRGRITIINKNNTCRHKDKLQTPDRNKLFEIMNCSGIPTKLVKLVSATMEGAKAYVKIQNDLTDHFEVKRGLK